MKRGSNQYVYKKRLELSPATKKSLWQILAIVAVLSLYIEKTRTPVISPLPPFDVYAQEKITPTPLPSPTTANITQYIVEVFEPEGKGVAMQAIDIGFCESGLRPDAYNFNTNKTGDYGPMQINSVHIKRFGEKFMYDWRENIRVAKALYDEQGWRPWTCARKLGIK